MKVKAEGEVTGRERDEGLRGGEMRMEMKGYILERGS